MERSARPGGSALPSGIVSFVLTDIEGSTRLLRSDPAAYPELLARHNAILRAAFGEGVEFDSAGDGLFYAFDDPVVAVAAAADAQRLLAAARWPPASEPLVRIGISTGAAEIAGGSYVGVELHRVARICAAAHGGQVLLGSATAALVHGRESPFGLRDLGEYRLKDFDEPERLFQLCAVGLRSSFPPPRTRMGRVVSLPREPTRLIGRDRDLEALQPLVQARRAVTLTGPGGSGKTRLGVAVGRNLAPRFRGTVAFVPLAPLSSSDRVPDVVMAALGRTEMRGGLADVIETLRDDHALLVLDNAEQLPDLAAVVAALLDACPQLHVLTTSRSPLGLAGEQVYPVGPLGEQAAVELLVERARARRPGFDADGEGLREVARRVACLPLGLELAAARLRGISAAGLAQRLDRQLDLLRDERPGLTDRQQTMRAAVEWSYRLLEPGDAALFESMAVFAAPARLEVVAHTSGLDEVDALDSVTRLVDASLVVFGDVPAARYGMLEPIRQYATERLGSRAGEVEDRLIDWYRVEAGDRLRFPGEVAGLRRDTENLFRALEYCATRCAWGWWLDIVFPVVHLLSRNLSGFEAITSTVARIPADDLSDRDRARLSVVRTLSSEAFSTRSWLATAEVARASGDPELECFTLLGLTNAYLSENRVEEAQATLEKAARFPTTAPVHRHYIHALTAAVAADSGSGEQAGEAYKSAVADAREIGDPEMLGVRLLEHAYLLVSWGQTAAALEAITEAQGLIEGDAHDRYDVAMTAALVKLMADDPRAGARDALEALHISPTLPPRGRRFPVSLLSLVAAALLAALERDAEAVTLAAFADRTIERKTELADRRVIERLHQYAADARERLKPPERRSADAASAAMHDRDAVVYAVDQIALALQEPATTQ